MPSYGQSVTIQYVAWDNSASSGKTGDSANHTLRWVKDGTSSATTNSPSEIDSTNAPGVYKITMTATEAQCQVGTLAGKSSTANVSIVPITITFENLPTASPASSGGLPTCGTGSNQLSTTSGKVQLDLTQAVPTSNTAETVGDALNAARAQGFGKWTISGTTLTLYANDGTTAVKTFTLDSATAPTSRS